MTQEEYNKRVYESTQKFTELFLSKEIERGNTWVLSSGGVERRRDIIRMANNCAIILVNTCNKI
jgi:hypothetical protein